MTYCCYVLKLPRSTHCEVHHAPLPSMVAILPSAISEIPLNDMYMSSLNAVNNVTKIAPSVGNWICDTLIDSWYTEFKCNNIDNSNSDNKRSNNSSSDKTIIMIAVTYMHTYNTHLILSYTTREYMSNIWLHQIRLYSKALKSNNKLDMFFCSNIHWHWLSKTNSVFYVYVYVN